MANILAEIRQRQHDLKAEATALLNTADTEAQGVLTDEQSARIEAIKSEIAENDTKLDAEIAALDQAPKAADLIAQGEATAFAAALAVIEICAVADVKATRVLGFVKDKKSADDVRKEILSDREAGTELNNHSANPTPDKPAAWDKAIAKQNAKVPGAK